MSSSYRLRCHIDFQDGSRCGAVLLPVLDWVSDFFQKVIVYLHTKFYHDKSICGWDTCITISDLAKNKRPPYWNSSSGFNLDHIPVIGMLFCISLSNVICSRVMTLYRFFYMHVSAAQYYFRFCICCRHCLQKVKVYLPAKFCAHDYLWLIYGYFRWGKRNVCHIGILLLISILTILP